MVEQRQARASTRAAGRGVDLSGAPDQRAPRHATRVGRLVEDHVVHRDLALSGHTHRQLLGDRLAHGHPAGGDLGDPLAPHRQADRGRLHDGEDVAGPHRDVERDLAHLGHLHQLRGLDDEGRRPLERHLAHPVALQTDHSLDGAGLGVDDHLSSDSYFLPIQRQL